MRKISAHYIYCGSGSPVKFGVVSLNGSRVIAVSDSSERMVETAQTEFYPGVIIPAIVNVCNADDENIWFPSADEEVLGTLTDQELPLFAVITPANISRLSAETLELLIRKGVLLTLGSPDDWHPVTLFRLMVRLAALLPSLSFGELVKVATVNGAAALEQKSRGTIAPHNEPGIYNISGFNFSKMNIDQNSKLNVLLD